MKKENDHVKIGIKQSMKDFIQKVLSLPKVLQMRFFKQIGASLMIMAMTIVMMVYFRTWQYCIGFLFALYVAYNGFLIVWDLSDEKIVCRRMRIIKCGNVVLNKERRSIVAKEIDTEEETLHSFQLSVNKNNSDLLDSNVILSVYFRPDRPNEVIEWEIIDIV